MKKSYEAFKSDYLVMNLEEWVELLEPSNAMGVT